MNRYFDYHYALRTLPAYLEGLGITLALSVCGILGAIVLALVLLAPLGSGRRIFSLPVVAYVELMRNTPLILQIYLFYFSLPLLGLRFSAFTCAVIAISAQHAAFLVEIFRAGLESLSKHQIEAAKALGMRKFAMTRFVTLPQAVLNVVPPLTNQLVILIKDTSLVSAIGVLDLTLTGKVLMDQSAAPFQVFVLVGFFYLVVTTVVAMLIRTAEHFYRARR
jgi:polar amino acid transport system permease protein